MGLFNALRTSVSGMAAQSNYLSAIGDNIANSSTVGYKEAQTQFETILGQQTPGSYESGGVLAQTTYGITDQGTLSGTTSSTDLAIKGNGFFVVADSNTPPGQYLTRAGSFSTDKTGNLVNTAGFTLMGYPVSGGVTSSTLQEINVSSTALKFSASTAGTVAGNLPSTDAIGATRSTTSTLYASDGTPVTANITYTNAGSGNWSFAATDSSGTSMGTGTLAFNTTTGALTSGSPITLAGTTASGSTYSASLDFSAMTDVASGFSSTATVDGSSPSSLASVTVDTDGTLTGVYGNGTKLELYKIPIATVTSPNNLTSITGNVYQQSNTSGALVMNEAGSGSAGKIQADNLEQSTVDLATELTNMITAQRAYEANSKVLQAASDLLSKLNNIQTG